MVDEQMKKTLAITVALSLFLTACGQPKVINGKTYPTYGLMNEQTNKSDKICYEASLGNIIWSVLLVEMVFPTVYFVGWSIFNPVRAKGPDGQCGIDAEPKP
jgi:hypothetical protein